VTVLVDLQTHDDAVAEHDAIQSRKFLCGLQGIVLDDEFPTVDVDLSVRFNRSKVVNCHQLLSIGFTGLSPCGALDEPYVL
jgi:hypothetical protein